MPAPMPPVVVLIVCKVLFTGPQDENDKYTGHVPTEWATENSMMTCRRHEIQVYDAAAGQGPELSFTPAACQRAIPLLSIQWDEQNKNKPWRVWRGACPTPAIDTRTGEIIDWVMPDCGHRDTVICEGDTVI